MSSASASSTCPAGTEGTACDFLIFAKIDSDSDPGVILIFVRRAVPPVIPSSRTGDDANGCCVRSCVIAERTSNASTDLRHVRPRSNHSRRHCGHCTGSVCVFCSCESGGGARTKMKICPCGDPSRTMPGYWTHSRAFPTRHLFHAGSYPYYCRRLRPPERAAQTTTHFELQAAICHWRSWWPTVPFDRLLVSAVLAL